MTPFLKKKRFKLILFLILTLIAGFCIPSTFRMPVKGADSKSYSQESFWFYPWGKSGTHKGVDIFAKKGTDVVAASSGWVVFTGEKERGGNVVIVLSGGWRFHYYAHLDQIHASSFHIIQEGERLGTVGNTGNAAGKPSHLHYSISRLLPLPWKADSSPQGWKKMFYENPIPLLNQSARDAE